MAVQVPGAPPAPPAPGGDVPAPGAPTAPPPTGDVLVPTPVQPPGTEALSTLLNWLSWSVSFACVVGALAVAAVMAVRHRRGEDGSEAFGKLGLVLVAAIVGAAAAPLVNAVV